MATSYLTLKALLAVMYKKKKKIPHLQYHCTTSLLLISGISGDFTASLLYEFNYLGLLDVTSHPN